ncbi:T9SS type B sorting domain-containing protein [Algoriphagus formosus]|uniref:Gliding motility-associated C-terminal domain-containing protein n=1 Tax=Algoriphagus formosus TaxID=2007308 RepID=A0A4R5VBH5_9BACT|nr:gliding motility-associated C-terminal domain-containing protein [Algoriphagus aquimaris]TDK49593.1 hypothetical protein E1898_03215 [Algoriphagus aquimaris]
MLFLQMDWSNISPIEKKSQEPTYKTTNETLIFGPDRICNYFGTVIGSFSGGGVPETDVYSWQITSPSGEVEFDRTGGFQTISFTFSDVGIYQVQLEILRGGISIGSELKEVELVPSPDILLEENNFLCAGESLDLVALDPESPDFEDYQFEWLDEDNNVIGDQNTISVSTPGFFSVRFFLLDSEGNLECETTISTEILDTGAFSILSDKSEICPTELISFSSDPPISGDWFFEKIGDPGKVFFTSGEEITINPNSALDGEGDYLVYFELTDPNNPNCKIETSRPFTFNPEPQIEFVSAESADGCSGTDGKLFIRALTPIDLLTVEGLGFSEMSIPAGKTIEIPNLKSGAYSIFGQLGNCFNTLTAIVPLNNPPDQLEFEIIDEIGETCTDEGKLEGSFTVKLENTGTNGGYRLFNERGAIIIESSLPGTDEFTLTVPGGNYFFELFDESLCNLPQSEKIEIESLNLVSYTSPTFLSICDEFELTPQTSQNLEFALTYPDGSEEIQQSGESFTILDEGTYTLVGRIPGQSVICPVTREIQVEKVEPVTFEPVLISEDCFGNRTFEANIFGRDPATVDFFWFDENEDLVGTGQFLNPVSTGTYRLDVQPSNSTACSNDPIPFEVREPVLSVDISLTTTKLCEFGPEAIVNLETTFPDEVTNIRWRRFNEAGEIVELPQFNDLNEIQTRVGGTYEVAVFRFIPGISVEECELGRATVQLDLTPDKVAFDIPSELTICERFELTPDTNQELDFFITSPSGSISEISTGESIVLDQTGVYTFLAFDQNSPTPFCPEQKEILVSRVQPVVYEPVLVEEFCDGSSLYSAELQNYSSEDVVFFWRDNTGNLLGQAQTLTITNPGSYSLEVQPAGSTPCEISPIAFEVAEPVLSVDVSLTSEPFCPDASSALVTVQSDFEQITTIEWWFTDPDGNQRQLNDLTNEREISASLEGSYEARVFNDIPCLLGREEILILRSQDEVRPDVDSVYQICPRLEIAPEINPGNFASYEWYFEDQLVSTSPTFKPLQIGNFDLIVTSLEGCTYSASFETEEECELRVQFPTAITPQDNQKPFLIYTNYLVDELELWIFNQWGELIFHCKNDQLITEESTCLWDGTYRGEKIPNGAYSIRINLVNYEKNINKTQLGSLMVID